MFGIEKIVIAQKIQNDFKIIVNEITKLAGNLLLSGEKFYVKVEGEAKGYTLKDIEISATSLIIEKKQELSISPGSEIKHDKLLYVYITKENAYASIFLDKGHQGIPNLSQKQQTVCPIFDEISALSCIETIKQGFDVKIIVAYKRKNDLKKVVKILNQVIQYSLEQEVLLEFYKFEAKNVSNIYSYQNSIAQLCKLVAKNSKISRISLPLSNSIFPRTFVESINKFIYKSGFVPHLPIEGKEDYLRQMAKEYVLEKYINKIKIHKNTKFADVVSRKFGENALMAIKNKQEIIVTIGPNNIHDILDAIEK